jgi:hypothetical protein
MIFTLICTLPIAVATAETSDQITAGNVKVTPEYVEADGVCSCSLMEDRLHHHAIFQNYCPACGAKGTLAFEQGSISYTCPEGMWYCKNCDADFCLVHGREHRERTNWYLKPYKIPSKPHPQLTGKNEVEVIKENWTKYNKTRIIKV